MRAGRSPQSDPKGGSSGPSSMARRSCTPRASTGGSTSPTSAVCEATASPTRVPVSSSDHGESWHPTIDIGADIHRVTTGHRRVYAAGAAGLSVSQDKGDTWTTSDEGLRGSYCRAVTVCGAAILVSASTGPRGGHSAVYRGDVDGRSFERCTQGLPASFEHNIDSLCLDAFPNGSLAAFGTEDGRVF